MQGRNPGPGESEVTVSSGDGEDKEARSLLTIWQKLWSSWLEAKQKLMSHSDYKLLSQACLIWVTWVWVLAVRSPAAHILGKCEKTRQLWYWQEISQGPIFQVLFIIYKSSDYLTFAGGSIALIFWNVFIFPWIKKNKNPQCVQGRGKSFRHC